MNTISLTKKFIGTAGVQLFAKGLTVLLGVIYARCLGPEEYGLFAYVLSIITLLALPTIAGLPNLLIREISSYQSKQRIQYIKGIVNWSRIYIIVISLLIISFTLVFLKNSNLDDNLVFFISSALLLVPIKALNSQQGAILNGFRKPVLAQFSVGIVAPVLSILILGIYATLHYDITTYIVIKITIFSSLIALVFSAFLIKYHCKLSDSKTKPQYQIMLWQKSLLPFSVITVTSVLNTELATVFVGWLDEPEAVAYFKVAAQGILLISISLVSVNSIIMPNLSRAYAANDISLVQNIATKSVRLTCVVGLPILLVLVIYGDIIIKTVFGPEYLKAFPSLVILCIGQLFNILMGSVGTILSMIKKEQIVLRTMLITLGVSVLLLFFLIPLYGIEGAAASVTLSMVFWNVIMSTKLYKATKIKSWLQ